MLTILLFLGVLAAILFVVVRILKMDTEAALATVNVSRRVICSRNGWEKEIVIKDHDLESSRRLLKILRTLDLLPKSTAGKVKVDRSLDGVILIRKRGSKSNILADLKIGPVNI